MPKKIKIKNTVPDLLEAVTTHKDCPDWLKTLIYNGLADKSDIPADCADMYRVMLKYTPTRKDELRKLESELSETDIESDEDFNYGTIEELASDGLASALSGVLNNPRLPEKLKEDFRESLTEFTNRLNGDKNQEFFNLETSPEYLARLFKIAEVKDE